MIIRVSMKMSMLKRERMPQQQQSPRALSAHFLVVEGSDNHRARGVIISRIRVGLSGRRETDFGPIVWAPNLHFTSTNSSSGNFLF